MRSDNPAFSYDFWLNSSPDEQRARIAAPEPDYYIPLGQRILPAQGNAAPLPPPDLNFGLFDDSDEWCNYAVYKDGERIA